MLTALFTSLLVAFSVIAHELAHGYVALLEGDDTALRAGRLSWNPLRHVDPLLTIVLPLATLLLSHGTLVFGGAKPVPVNPHRYRDGARSDVLVSLAGVAANALIALACVPLLAVWPAAERVLMLNVALVVFNLLPFPPLDGWRVWRILRRGTQSGRDKRSLSADAKPLKSGHSKPLAPESRCSASRSEFVEQ